MLLRWIADRSVNCLHAAAAMLEGRACAPAPLVAALDRPVAALGAALEALRIEAEPLMRHLVPLAASIDDPTELVRRALLKAFGPGLYDASLSQLGGFVAGIKSAAALALPDVLDELELRGGPLREQWEARGPGLLALVSQRTAAELLVESADIFLTSPVLGGDGEAHLSYNSVRIEAVLANPHAELPEGVRLAWLLAVLNQDLPRYSENLSPRTRDWVVRLAMLPPVLEAAAEVEWAANTPDVLATALRVWHLSDGRPLAETLSTWWQTYAESRPGWSVALRALERLLA